MSGKGSTQRPRFIPLHEYVARYTQTFPAEPVGHTAVTDHLTTDRAQHADDLHHVDNDVEYDAKA